ncbi:MAG TPA: MFS transporter [Candidatus Sulfotelmatobacter sp.]|nr:MFS transporter [Candidatus Sulfotelmatobacter sp.]
MNRVIVLMVFSILINYIDRSNLSIAAPLLQHELGISNTQLGTLLAAFFTTYALMQIPSGWLVDHFDVKWVFAGGFLLWSAATAVTGALHSFAALIIVRVILGIGESVAFPSYSNILGNYFSEARRGFPNALMMAGTSLGPAIGILIGGEVVGTFGWRPFFVVLGVGCLLWLIPWLAWMPRKTASPHPAPKRPIDIPAILRQRSAWGTCLGQFAINYYIYFLVTWFPTYLTRAHGLSLRDAGKYSALLFLSSSASAILFGKLSDHWINAGATPTQVRKGTSVVGQVGIGICLLLTVFAEGRTFLVMLVLTGVAMGMGSCSTWAVTQTLAGPHAAGRWTGVQNFIGNFAGWIAPFLTGFLLDKTGHFFWPFLITACVSWIGAASWAFIVGAVEPVDWERCASPGIVPTPAAPLA